MSLPQVALHYARALYEVSAEAESLEETSRDVRRVVKLLETVAGLRDYCRAHRSDRRTDQTLVETAFLPSVSPRTGIWLRLLAQNDRLPVLLVLAEAWQRLLDEHAAVIPVLVETCQAPEPVLLSELASRLRSRTGRDVRLEVQVLPELKGGWRLFWRDRLLDASLDGRLRQLRVRSSP